MKTVVKNFREIRVAEIRHSLGLTQKSLASLLGISVATLRNWEQGRVTPSGPAKRLLEVVANQPDALLKLNTKPTVYSQEQLMDAVGNLGVVFFSNTHEKTDMVISPTDLFVELSKQANPRLRLAIIAILLQQPSLSGYIPVAVDSLLNIRQKNALRLYYQVAHTLQLIHSAELKELVHDQAELPDYFSFQLGATQVELDKSLRELAILQAENSGVQANWYGSFRNTGDRIVNWLNKEREWATK